MFNSNHGKWMMVRRTKGKEIRPEMLGGVCCCSNRSEGADRGNVYIVQARTHPDTLGVFAQSFLEQIAIASLTEHLHGWKSASV